MGTILLSVSIDDLNDCIGEVDVEVELSDEHYAALEQLVNDFNGKGETLSEEILEEFLPNVHAFIREYVDGVVPDMIELDEDQDISDFTWFIQYPDDICEMF